MPDVDLPVAGGGAAAVRGTTTPACARRVADLTVYVRQSHAERDPEELGSLIVECGTQAWKPPW